MRLNGNQRKLISEELDNAFACVKVPMVDRDDLKKGIFSVIRTLPEASFQIFDKKFYDFRSSLGTYAQRENIDTHKALAAALKHPVIFFRPLEFPELAGTIPSFADCGVDKEVVKKSVSADIEVTGNNARITTKQPQFDPAARPAQEAVLYADGKAFPKNGITMQVSTAAENSQARTLAPKSSTPRFPENRVLMECIYYYRKHHGEMPKGGRDFLPGYSPGWSAIGTWMKERGGTIKSFYMTGTYTQDRDPEAPVPKKPSKDEVIRTSFDRYFYEKSLPPKLLPPVPEKSMKMEKPETPEKPVKAQKPEKPPRKILTIPDDQTLVRAMHKHFADYRKMPITGRHCLPDDARAWPVVLADVRRRGFSPKNFYREHLHLLSEEQQREAAALLQPRQREKPVRAPKIMPERDVLVAAAVSVRAEKKRLPNGRDKYDGLPEGSYGWAHICNKVKLRKLVEEHDARLAAELSPPRINASAVFRHAVAHYTPAQGFNGVLADMDKYFHLNRVDGLKGIFKDNRAKEIKTTEDFLVATGVMTRRAGGEAVANSDLIRNYAIALELRRG